MVGRRDAGVAWQGEQYTRESTGDFGADISVSSSASCQVGVLGKVKLMERNLLGICTGWNSKKTFPRTRQYCFNFLLAIILYVNTNRSTGSAHKMMWDLLKKMAEPSGREPRYSDSLWQKPSLIMLHCYRVGVGQATLNVVHGFLRYKNAYECRINKMSLWICIQVENFFFFFLSETSMQAATS